MDNFLTGTIASSKSKRSKLSSVSFLGKNKLREKQICLELFNIKDNDIDNTLMRRESIYLLVCIFQSPNWVFHLWWYDIFAGLF